MLRTFREFLQWREGDAIILAEANVLPDTDMQYFGDEGERLQMMFNFQVNQNRSTLSQARIRRPLEKALKAHASPSRTAQWGSFLRNHDEFDLGRLTPDQRSVRVRCFRTRSRHATLRAGNPPKARADARRRPPPSRTGLQHDADPAGHAGVSLWRRDRHGR